MDHCLGSPSDTGGGPIAQLNLYNGLKHGRNNWAQRCLPYSNTLIYNEKGPPKGDPIHHKCERISWPDDAGTLEFRCVLGLDPALAPAVERLQRAAAAAQMVAGGLGAAALHLRHGRSSG